MFADHVKEGLSVGGVVGETSANLSAVIIVGGERECRWRTISALVVISCPRLREIYQYQVMREEVGAAGNCPLGMETSAA